METLIALFLVSSSAIAKPMFKVSHCYSSDSEFRPNIIKIDTVGQKEYLYSVYIKPAAGEGYYTVDLNAVFSTIESVYEKEIVCPSGT